MKYKLPSILTIILISNACFSLFLLLIYLAQIISPQQFWLLAFIGLLFPFALLINIIYVLFWLFKQKKYALISGLTILLGWGAILNYFGLNFTGNDSLKDNSKGNIRVMAYNVHAFSSVDKPLERSYQRVLDMIKSKQPDIITFEEFSVKNSQFRFCDSLQNILKSNNYYFEPFVKTPYDSTGLAIFSKLPIVKRNILRLSNEESDNQGIYIDVKSPEGIIRVYCFHLQSVMITPLDIFFLKHRRRLDIDSKMTIVLKLKNAYIKRGQQANLIKKEAANCPYPYIFAGDFNDTPNSYTLHTIADGMRNTFRDKGSGFGFTFDTRMSMFQIDYILTSPQFSTVNYQIVKQKMSDHYPIYADIALKK